MAKCSNCNKTGLNWKKENGRWYLYTTTGTVHFCPISDKKAREYAEKKALETPICRHLLPKEAYCAKCIEEEKELQRIEAETGFYRK